LGKDLGVFALIVGDDRSVLVKEHEAGARGARVDGADVLGHDQITFKRWLEG